MKNAFLFFNTVFPLRHHDMMAEKQIGWGGSQKCDGNKEDVFTRVFDLMQSHVKEMPYTPSQKENLRDLLSLTKKRWSDIIQRKDISECRDDSLASISHDRAFPHLSPTNGNLLGEFCRDLTCASFTAGMNAGSGGPMHYQLSRTYIFNAELGPKDGRVKKHISVLMHVSADPEIVMINYPGKRILAIEVGTCQQFDSRVYFGDDGKIYLVDSELLLQDPPVVSGRKVYESEETLLWSWRTFTMIRKEC